MKTVDTEDGGRRRAPETQLERDFLSVVEHKRHLLTENTRLRTALERIKLELGVPGEGTPSPVSNAWVIADEALEGEREK